MAIVNNVNILKLSEFLPSVKHQLCDKHQDVIGGVLKSTNYSWLAYGPTILVINNTNATIRTSWSFQNQYDNSDITCVVELPLAECQIPLLIVGISSVNSSKLCIFNPNTRKVIRTLQLNIQVRCLAVIEDGDLNNVHPLPEILGQMNGVLAVGGADGSVILTDLNREFIIRAIEGDMKCESNEDKPNDLKLVSLEDSAAIMQLKLNKAQLFGDSLGIVLVDGGSIVDDGVTALEYSKETACLYVGYSAGSWQLWNLITFRQLYCSPDSEFPVFGFAQLEPCDDPRHTVYVWVACQAPSLSLPLASLYSISYGKKDIVQGYGSFYEDFQQCNLVFEMSPGEEVEGVTSARVISVGTISKTINKPTNSCIGLPDCDGTQLRLTATVYSIERKSQIETRMLLFDLNRWYAEQMPSSIEETTVQLTRAGVVRSLLDISTLSPSHLVALKILENTVDVFTNPSVDTSCAQLSFEVLGVNCEGVLHGEKLGAQKEWLRNSELAGSRALIHPQQLYRACLNSGLSVIYTDYFDFDNPSVDEMRSYILAAWLEYKMFSCIMDCADCWYNGSHSVSGCTLAYLLDWLWSQFVHCKTVAHHLCRILFDGSGLEFDLAERKKLKHCKVLIHSVYTLYSQIAQKYSKFILNESTENKLRAISLLISYIDQVVFFIYLGVLPELNHLGLPRSSIAYDYVRLQKYVSQRNLYLIGALEECRRTRPHIAAPVEGLYMVDSFNFSKDGIKVIDYPAHSVQLLLRIWLKLETSVKEKFSLSYYFLLDLMHICQDDKYHECMEKVANYPSTLAMTNSQVCLVKALWHLDHSFYEDGMKLLMSSQVLSSDITDSQNRSILRLLFVESRYNLALQYLTSKQPALHLPDDLRFEMSLLLSNNLINEAHLFQRTNSRFRDSLLMQFFTEQNINQLKNIIKLNLDSKEEAMFIKFLKDKNDARYDDLYIMFLISRAKFEEVVELHRKVKSRNGCRGTNARDRFVEGISSSISSVNNKLINIDSIFQTYSIPKNVTKPLSVYVKTSMSEGFPAPQMSDIAVAALALKCARRTSAAVQHQQSNGPVEVHNFLDGFAVMPTREVTGIRARPAPLTPHGKRTRTVEQELSTSLIARHEAKKQKLEDNKETLDKLEVERLLATPLIERRRPPRAAQHLDSTTPNSAPHSILKKISDNKTKTPVKGENHTMDGADQMELTPRKSLRFTLPREERSSAKLKSSVRLSARRSLRSSDTNATSTPDQVVAMETSASSSSSLSAADLSEESMKDVVCSTPLQTSIKRTSSTVDWKSILEESKPKTLFTIGSGGGAGASTRKITSSSNTTNKTYLDGFLRKMAMEPATRSDENHVNKDEQSKDVSRMNDCAGAGPSLLVNNRGADLANDRSAGVEDTATVSPSQTTTPTDQESAYRTRSSATLRSSKLVEDLLLTPRTRLRKRLEEKLNSDRKSADDGSEVEQQEKLVANEIQSTPTRRMQRIEMHVEKKVRLEIKEVEEDEDDDGAVDEQVEQFVDCGEEEEPAAGQQAAAIESEEIVDADKCEANVQLEISDDCTEEGKEEDEIKKLEVDQEAEYVQVEHVASESVDVQSEECLMSAAKVMPMVGGLPTAVTPRDYHALTPVSDPVMLGAVAPAQPPLQDYFTGDDDDEDEEDDELYGDLEEAEEAEMPPKMDFDQPEEGGFGGLYEDLYEQENVQAAAAATSPSSKPQKSDSDSSVICLDSDSETEPKNYSKNNSTKLDYEEESMDEDENSSPPLRSRSFFHDKFSRRSPEYDDCEDEEDEEEDEDDEETDGESLGEDEHLEEEEEEYVEDYDEEQENRERDTEDEDIEEIEEFHSEDKEEHVVIGAGDDGCVVEVEDAQPDKVVQEKLVSNEVVEEPKVVQVEPTVISREAPAENIEPAETYDSQSMPTLSKELDSNVPSEHCDEQAPELVKEIEVETCEEVNQKSDETSQEQKNTHDSFNLCIMEVTSAEKSEEVEELWLTPTKVEEVNEDGACKNDPVTDVKESSSCDEQATSGAVEAETLAALALKRKVEHVEVTAVGESSKQDQETIVLEESEIEIKETQVVITPASVEGEQSPVEIKLQVDEEMFADNMKEAESAGAVTEAKPGEDSKKEGLEELENVVDKVDLSDPESDNHATTDDLSVAEQNARKIPTKGDKIDSKEAEERQKEEGANVVVNARNDSESVAEKSKTNETETSSDVNFVDAESGEMKTADKEPKQQSDNIPVDLFTLGKGQMFFGSPEDVKTSATELATFQVGRTSLSGPEEGKTNDCKDDERSTASSMDYSVAEMDLAMIVNDSVSTPAATPCQTPVGVSTRKRRFKATPAASSATKKNIDETTAADDDADVAVLIEDGRDLNESSGAQHIQVPQQQMEKTESEKLEMFKNLLDRSKHKDKEESVVESSLAYLELSTAAGSSQKAGSKRAEPLSPSRRRRASSEQPSRGQLQPSAAVTVDNEQMPRRHTRASLDVARIYPSTKRRESLKRRRTESEQGALEDDGDGNSSKFSLAEFIHSISAKPSTSSETVAEESDQQKHSRRPRKSSCSHADRSEKLGEVLDARTRRHSKESKKSSIEEEAAVQPEAKKSKRLSRKSSMIPSPPLGVIVEEETPKSAKTNLRMQKSEPSAKKMILFSEDEDVKDVAVQRRSEKARSLPPSLSPRRSSAKLSVLPIVDEEEELRQPESPLPRTSRSKKSSSSAAASSSPSRSKRKSTHLESTAATEEAVFQQPVVPSVEDFTLEGRNKGKPRSLPDLSTKRKKSSVRMSILPKVPEEEDVKGTQETGGRRSIRGRSAASTGSNSKTSVSSVDSSRDSVTIASNASAWAEKMFGQTQAKWWAKIKEQQQKSTRSVQNTDSSNENSLSAASSPAAMTRSKTNASPSSVISSPELTTAKYSTRKRKDADTESVKSDRSGRSSRAKRDDVAAAVRSDKAVSNSSRSSKKDVETCSVKSDRSTRSARKEVELTATESERSVRSRRKNEVEILLLTSDISDQKNTTTAGRRRRVSTSSGQSQKKRARTKKESSASPGASSDTSQQIDEQDLAASDTQQSPDKNADVSLMVEEYAENRRLTRHQKSLLERSFTGDKNPAAKREAVSEAVAASSDSEPDDDDVLITPVRPRTRSSN